MTPMAQSKHSHYRNLSVAEIEHLKANGCTADDWSCVAVSSTGFRTDRVRHTHFGGCCTIGRNDGSVRIGDATTLPSGIYRAELYNCKIGHNCRIHNIGQYISNYHIADNCLISDCSLIETNKTSSFGLGMKISVLNEAGGREVTITDLLTAHTAYLMAMAKGDNALQTKLSELSEARVAQVRDSIGSIEENCRLRGCNTIRNTYLGQASQLDGCSRIEDSYICSSPTSVTHVGYHCSILHSVVALGAQVEEAARIDHCFVGEACSIASGFSAESSLFFANCTLHNGESCAAFLGPYSVSMHKSTLLIGGLFSFSNSGSGSNQSNHYYRLGPIHHGIVERGCKLASDSYLLWPAHIGAFSIVKGRHSSGLDTSLFPFSYLIEENGQTALKLGYMLGSVGLARDAEKWPLRDRRKGERRDCLSFEVLSPYTMGKVLQTLSILRSKGPERQALLDGITLSSKANDKGIELYSLAIEYYFFSILLKHIGQKLTQGSRIDVELPDSIDIEDPWIDLGGLLIPHRAAIELCESIASGRFTSLNEINNQLLRLHERYDDFEWEWFGAALKRFGDFTSPDLSHISICKLLHRGLFALIRLFDLIYQDALKEYTSTVQIVSNTGIEMERKSPNGETFDLSSFPNPFLRDLARQRIGIMEQTLRLLDQLGDIDAKSKILVLTKQYSPQLYHFWQDEQ